MEMDDDDREDLKEIIEEYGFSPVFSLMAELSVDLDYGQVWRNKLLNLAQLSKPSEED